jgi:SAM-dependent methyltransferase
VNAALGDFDLLATLVDALDLRSGETVFDVGCGSGQHLARFAGCVAPGGRAQGFDLSPAAVAATCERGLEATVADLARLPVLDACADGVACSYAVYYHPELADVVAEWRRVLRRGGRLAVSGPALDNNRELYEFHRQVAGADLSDADRLSFGYVEGPVVDALKSAGFEAVEVRCFVNRICFPDAGAFLDYWRSTSLFLRTPDVRFEAGAARLADHRGTFMLHKRVALVTARR